MSKLPAIFSGCCVMFAAVFSTAQAQDSQYHKAQPLTRGNVAQVIVRAAEYPEVAVDRSLSSQPVHPWMAEVQTGVISTYIDPAQDLSHLDESHSLRRAQQYYNSMTGVTTNDLAALKNDAMAAQNRIPQGNRAQTVVMPAVLVNGNEIRNMRIILPAQPKLRIPSVPKQQPRPADQLAVK